MASVHISRAGLALACVAFLACGKASPNDPGTTGDGDTGVLGDDTSGGGTGDTTTPPGDAPAGKDSNVPPTDAPVGSDTKPPPADTSGGPCADDMQCAAPNGYCPAPGAPCATLPSQTCSGSSASSCLGAKPRCKDQACFNGGECASDADCHAGETCVAKGSAGKLCFPTSPCTETVSAADVANGKYAAGKEVCIDDTVHSVIPESDGDQHVRMAFFTTVVIGICPFPVTPPGKGLVTELTPEYAAAGLSVPAVGAHVKVQGTVRWDGAHCWWEIHPVKYIGP